MVARCGIQPRRWARRAWFAGLLAGSLVSTVGCQVEYAGMTLPSGKYMRDDVQYFPPGPAFPWANTQAATQRARMQAMGLDPNAVPAVTGPAAAPRGGQMPPPPVDANPLTRNPITGMPAPVDAAPRPGVNQPAPDVPPPPQPGDDMPADQPPGGF